MKTATPRFVPQKPGYSIREAAAYIGVSERTVFELLNRKLLRRCKALRRTIIPGADVETFLERNS
jgi:excisionase family DNA binding protein